jgi:hypothetical protein
MDTVAVMALLPVLDSVNSVRSVGLAASAY